MLLITDEIAQTSVESLPLIGAIRSQLASDVQPVFSPDGTIVETSNAQPLWTGEGLAPRLFEQVEIQRFELAQNSAEDPGETESPNAVVGGGVMVGGVLAAITLALPPEATAEEMPAADPQPDPQPDPLPQPVLPFLSDAAFQALSPPRAWTGSTADNYIGYSAASLANPDPIQSAAYATFDMSAGGSNYLLAGLGAGSAGSFSYTGGSGDDTLSFNEDLGYVGSASFDM